NTDNNTSQQSFTASGVADTHTDPPFLGPIPANFNVATGQTLNYQLSSTDLSNGGVDYEIAEQDNPIHATVDVDHDHGMVTVVPDPGFVGTINVIVGVRASAANGSVFDNYDVQTFTVTVSDRPTLDPVADQITGVGVADSFTLSSTDP